MLSSLRPDFYTPTFLNPLDFGASSDHLELRHAPQPIFESLMFLRFSLELTSYPSQKPPNSLRTGVEPTRFFHPTLEPPSSRRLSLELPTFLRPSLEPTTFLHLTLESPSSYHLILELPSFRWLSCPSRPISSFP